MNRPALTVEIHDISPAVETEVHAIRTALADIGIERLTLLVVPRYLDEQGRSWDLRQSTRLMDWLRQEQTRGSDIVLHGFTHRAPGRPPAGLQNTFFHYLFARGCAEFAHLNAAEAARRLRQGRRILRQCGLRAQGFIAPAWLQSPQAIGAVAGQGFDFTAFFNKIMMFSQERLPGRCIETPVLTFDAADPLIDVGKRAFMRALEFFARTAPLVRVAFHPIDVYGKRPVLHILSRLKQLLELRRHTTYAEILIQAMTPIQDRCAA
jgi:predicted deacetylase